MATANIYGTNIPLDITKLNDVLKLLRRCKFPNSAWKDLGLALGLYDPTLKAIEANYSKNVDQCLRECLSKWLYKSDGVTSTSVDKLVEAVELTLSVEEYLPLWLRKRLIVGHHIIYPNKKLRPIQHFLYNVLGLFRVDSAQNIKNALNAPPSPIEEVQEQNRRLAKQVDVLKDNIAHITEQNDNLHSMITQLAERQGVFLQREGSSIDLRPPPSPRSPKATSSPRAATSPPPGISLEKLHSQPSFI